MVFFSGSGWLSAVPMGVPPEWNVVMMFGVLWLFVDHVSRAPEPVSAQRSAA